MPVKSTTAPQPGCRTHSWQESTGSGSEVRPNQSSLLSGGLTLTEGDVTGGNSAARASLSTPRQYHRGVEFIEPDDDHDRRFQLLPPEDRLWRHPSEWNKPAPEPASPHRIWPVALASAATAGILSACVVLALSGILDIGSSRGPSKRQVFSPASEVSDLSAPDTSVLNTSAPDTSADRALASHSIMPIVERVRPALVTIRVGPARTGSGIMFRNDGYLLTNAHLVGDQTSVTVVLGSGEERTGRVLGFDSDTDTAVAKIEGGPFPVVSIGSASTLRVGQPVVLLRSPTTAENGPSPTVVAVSALHQDAVAAGVNRPMFDMVQFEVVQTDTPVLPGSSGGALVDPDGRLVGMATALADGRGFGFATPIEVAQAVSEQIMTHGRPMGVWLGVQGVDRQATKTGGGAHDGGAVVAEIMAGGPAEGAGLAVGDVIVTIDNQPISSMGRLVVALRGRNLGDSVTITYLRNSARRTARAVLAQRPTTQ